MRWIMNGHRSEEAQNIRFLQGGHDGKRRVIIGDPKPGTYPIEVLKAKGTHGYYEVMPCQCDFCKELRASKTQSDLDVKQ